MEWAILALLVAILTTMLTLHKAQYGKQNKSKLSLVEADKIEPIILPDSYRLHPKLSNETTRVHIVQCESRLSRKLSKLHVVK